MQISRKPLANQEEAQVSCCFQDRREIADGATEIHLPSAGGHAPNVPCQLSPNREAKHRNRRS